MPQPNAPTPRPLAQAQERMARAAFVVLADAADAEARGEAIGVWRDVLHQQRAFLPFARNLREAAAGRLQ